ncbi:MAG: hypothetical protein ACI8X5_001512 [Planctomycetota bacterium]
MNQSKPNHANVVPTPAIDKLLKRLRSRLTREVWLFGIGRTALALSVLALAAFLIDWTLHVPSAVRLAHLVVIVALPVIVLWRDLIGRLRKIPGPSGLAVLVERAHPELKQVLVSAVELREGSEQTGSEIDQDLVRHVIREAEERAAQLELTTTTDPRGARTSFGLGALSVAAAALTFMLQADAARIFFARISGGPTPWPQHTHLIVEIPLAGELHSSRDLLELSIARGNDLPVIVRSEGRIPDDVQINFEGGHEALLGSAGRGVFRTLLRSVQEDMVFSISGGDDQDGTPTVRIRVLQPPDISAIAIQIVPPAYSGLPERVELDRDVRVLANSKISIFMVPDPASASGIVRLLPRDQVHELEERSFPTLDAANALVETRQSLAFDLVAQESLRYRFELQDSTGLTNPDPGLFGIEVQIDRAPEIELLSPSRGEVESVIGGSLPLKVLAYDDFAVNAMSWSSIATSGETPIATVHELEASTPIHAERSGEQDRAHSTMYAARRIEVAELFGSATPAEGEVFQIEVSATDNREPSSQESRSAPVRLRIISTSEFLRRIQDRLSRVRGKVEALAALMQDKQGYTHDLVASLESDEPGGADTSAITTALSGARRVSGDAKALSREVASIAEALLYSRVDDRAELMLSQLERGSLALADRNFHAAPWIELCDLQRQGKLGKADFADKLVEIVGLALDISEVDSQSAIDGLRRSQDLFDISAQHETLLQVADVQSEARSKVEKLLALLSEWDSYQSLMAATRELLSAQKNQLDRTRQYYKDN